jgi:hypothetical protein
VAPQQSSNQAQYSQPQTYGSFSYAAAPLTSKNGPAKASLILILLLVLGVSAILWLLTGADPAMQLVFGVLNILMVIAAFILAIIGLVIAVRRPTKKRESVFALVVSSIMLVGIVGFMIFTANQLDVPGLESQIEVWATTQTGEGVNVTCPPNPPSAVCRRRRVLLHSHGCNGIQLRRQRDDARGLDGDVGDGPAVISAARGRELCRSHALGCDSEQSAADTRYR